MIPAPHPQEAARLEALRAYGILDTPADSAFDEVAALLAAICEAPVAVVNLVDGDRAFHLAEVGLGRREGAREVSFCAHAILEGAPFVEIPDTTLDPRTRDNPHVLDDGIRFYAGAVLTGRAGLPLGTLCVLDVRPRRLNDLQKQALMVLSRQVMQQMELRQALQGEKVLRQEVDHRVKNSLQAVSSLARIQSRRACSAETRDALEQVRGRIEVISALHEEIYRTDAGDRIDLARFAGNVTRYIGGFRPENVRFQADIPQVHVTSRQASSIGVIINEFASNSFRHGFPEGRRGTVRVSARPRPDGGMTLVCEDDGIGLDATAAEGTGLGMQVIAASAEQLGSIPLTEDAGPGLRLSVGFTPLT